jgi:hypothetical protein
MEVYVDDMQMKSTESGGHIHYLREAFGTLKQYEMKLNPVKYAFKVSSRKFLGYMVSSKGIEANPEKIRAVLEMQSPKTTKRLQQLNRFIYRSTNKCLPFFKVGSPKPVHFSVHSQMPPFLQGFEENLRVDQ